MWSPGAKNPLLVSAYVCTPPAFRNHKSQSYGIQNLSSISTRKSIYSKLLVEIGTPEVDNYMKDFFWFSTIFWKISVFIKCYKLNEYTFVEITGKKLLFEPPEKTLIDTKGGPLPTFLRIFRKNKILIFKKVHSF